jgi:hypothetical protein
MDLLDEARLHARHAWWKGRSWFGPVLPEDEAEAIGVAALFEVQDARPGAPRSELVRDVRTRVLNAMRDEVRFLRRELPLEPDTDPQATGPGIDSRLDADARVEWLAGEVQALPWNDRRLLEETWLRSSSAPAATLPRRFGSRWTVRRGLDRVLQRLRDGAGRRFGQG